MVVLIVGRLMEVLMVVLMMVAVVKRQRTQEPKCLVQGESLW